MSLKSEVSLIETEMAAVKNIFSATVNFIPSFNITDEKILPYGLRAHTRSISWIVEQAITQQAKFHASEIGVSEVDFNMPDTCLHDCVIDVGENRYFVNVKIYNVDGRPNKNNLSAVAKLFMQYDSNLNYRLIFISFGIRVKNQFIRFDKNYINTFSPQFLPIYVNPKSDKLQAFYQHNPIYRSRKEFLELLAENSKGVVLDL
ncbi:MAG: hypothetical protein ACR2HG_14855 [Pyrinomonadaceae bacterium]